MTSLPASIEAYLQEAGFSTTEILILKRLLVGHAMTLRELAAKTGKSTGVLDQATKKLAEKNILGKEHINGSPKYALASLDAIQHWMQKDMEQKKEILQRKKKDFDAFLSTVTQTKERPEMQYFEGIDGLQKAFTKLLEKNESEWLHCIPAVVKEEEDPLQEFRVNLFRERRKSKTFMRSITQNIPLGLRYKHRDIFEYRDTRLVSAEQFPVSFEEFIVGDTVACFDMPNKKASFIQYPELAASQRHMFEMLWCLAEEGVTEEECKIVATQTHIAKEPDIETKVASGLREFFILRKNIVLIASIALVVGTLSFRIF